MILIPFVATRFTASKDFGYLTLDLSHTLAEDAGIYTCKATNAKGEAVTSGSLKIIDGNFLKMNVFYCKENCIWNYSLLL